METSKWDVNNISKERGIEDRKYVTGKLKWLEMGGYGRGGIWGRLTNTMT